MTSLPDLRYETARDHLLQALAILPQEGSEVIRLLVEEAARRCEARAYHNVPDLHPLPPDPQTRPG
ncbi:hypothetical protein [Devosia ginsengisoli]|uniref:Uncharacterized protein n=1 Tax=Devosia ginsengisoli TaxID=400770 RepID=A0A5B8LVL2_9HYPH|nr:hypothetical protein [Devosia ginsengisoli]QDZ12398.1 hypothetical protein FPZ08_17560 [Devosia ginsengisoli]